MFSVEIDFALKRLYLLFHVGLAEIAEKFDKKAIK